MDTRTPEQRSYIMRSVRSRNTGPELIVRQILHRMGFRFRLHRKSLSGCPDIVLARHRAIIFVHGCFWHGHACSKGRLPKSRLGFWTKKIVQNRRRDSESVRSLRKAGWRILTIWQCQTKDERGLRSKLLRFLGARKGIARSRSTRIRSGR